MAAIVCRSCGASSSKGDEFVVKEAIIVIDYHRVVPTPTGIASVEIETAGEHPSPHGKPTLMCVSCEHEWTTTRDIDWMGER